MGHLVAQLLPEMVGLAVTPAAIVATLILLGTPHPWRNTALFGGAFLVVYSAISLIAWLAGRHASTTGDTTLRGWTSVVLGSLFLLGAIASWRQLPQRRDAGTTHAPPPGWVRRLAAPSPGQVIGVGVLLSLVNPNVAILASGLAIVFTSGVDGSQQAGGVGLLLASSMLDFVAPAAVLAVAGPTGRDRLGGATRFLVRHHQGIGTGVLAFFGLLFLARGLAVVISA